MKKYPDMNNEFRTIAMACWFCSCFSLMSVAQNISEDLQDFKQLNQEGTFLEGDWNSPSSYRQELGMNDSLIYRSNAQNKALFYSTSETKMKDGDFILEAYQADKEDRSLWEEVMEYYGMTHDIASVKVMADKISSQVLIPARVITYHRLLLAQLKPGSVVISHGEWDTACLQIAVAQSNIDVIIINVHWLRDPGYLSAGLEKIGMKAPSLKSKASDCILDLVKKNPNRQFHITLSQNKTLLTELKNELTLEGLSFIIGSGAQSSSSMIQSFNALKTLTPFLTRSSDIRVSRFELNYLPLLVRMEKYALNARLQEDATWARSWMDELRIRAGQPIIKSAK